MNARYDMKTNSALISYDTAITQDIVHRGERIAPRGYATLLWGQVM